MRRRSQDAFVKQAVLLLASLLLVFGSLHPLTGIRSRQPPEERLGFYPPAPVVRALSAEHYHFLSQVIFLNCIFYYGTLVERKDVPNWERMYEALSTSARLDPYNMDTYYLCQAVLTWDAGMVRRAVELLEFGFQHRSWDWYLPLFLSFDYAYFFRDYEKAAHYMARAAELNKRAAHFSTLAARYWYEGGRTALALAYLKELIPHERNETIKKRMIVRARALEAILILEKAVATFKKHCGRLPRDIGEMQQAGFIDKIPVDPYGGTFYLDREGKVRTTSKLAGPPRRKDR